MNVDALTSLTRGGAVSPNVPAPKRRWATRVALPVVILLLCGGLLAYAARDAFLPATPVKVVRAMAKEGGGGESNAAPAPASVSVQAPGWLEPDPYPTYVTALANGVIKEIRVLEGQPVKAGQIVATLVDDDAKLAVAKAEAEVVRRKATFNAAQTEWDNPIALQRAVAVSQARVAEAKAELAQLDATIAQHIAKRNELQAGYDRVRELSSGAASKLEIETASFKVIAQQSLVDATKQQRPVIEAQIERHVAEQKAAEAELRLRIIEKQTLEETAAAVKEAEALRDEAKLRLSRMEVISPVAGIVMNRMVAPGAKVSLDGSVSHSAHIVHVYDPKHMQVRVDVPLSDAAKIGVGQKARVVVDVLPEHEFVARVTRFVHLADIGKNTVEVKVAIENPSPLLKPDMLARVKFLATASNEGEATAVPGALTVYTPASAVNDSAGEPFVWVVAPRDQRLKRQGVKLGGKRADGWIAVIEGLNPGDALVADPSPDLKDGQRVSITNANGDSQ